MARFLARAILGLAAAAAGSLHAAAPAAGPLAARVVILANRSDPESLAIAQHYAEARGVPAANLFAYSMPLTEAISWTDFLGTIWQPLQDELVTRGWIDAVTLSSTDAIGRRRYAVAGHRIAALVVCRGVPLRIEDDPTRHLLPRRPSPRPELQTNSGAVDSELSLLAADGGYAINSFVRNPLYAKDRPGEFDRMKVVKVARLDAPDPADALALVDRAMAAERAGLVGRAYVDRGVDIPLGEGWLTEVARQLGVLGFDTAVDTAPATLPPTARCDAPVLYFGWHADNLDGPFTLPGFRLAPGAVAFHIHSYSAASLRTSDRGWCGPLLARGAAATLGNVAEPYLEYTHRPDLFLRALARGDDLVDAAYYALPVLSWQGIVLGDPLYRPFAVSLEEELTQLAHLPADLAGYAVLRAARRLEAEKKPQEALGLMKRGQAERPNLALALALGQRLREAGQTAEAGRVVERAISRQVPPADRWTLAHDAADFLTASGRPGIAVKVYRRLLRLEALPRALREVWLAEGIRLAATVPDAAQAAAWQRELDELMKPPPKQ